MDKDVFIEDIQLRSHGFTRENGGAAITMDDNFLRWPNMFDAHSHHMLELSLVKSGSGSYEIGNHMYDLVAGDIFVIGNTEAHRIVLRKGQYVDNLTIHFETSFLWNFYGQTEDIQLLDVFFNRGANFSPQLDRANPSTKEVADLILKMEQVFITQPPYYKLRVKILLETILCSILCNYDYCEASHNSARLLSHKDIYKIDEVMDYINFHLGNHLTLQELAKIACVSPAYFSSIFKRYNGVTLFEYITQKRVDYAIQLIKTSNKSLMEIATLCGFNSSTSFNKAFSRITGLAPSYYRKKGGT